MFWDGSFYRVSAALEQVSNIVLKTRVLATMSRCPLQPRRLRYASDFTNAALIAFESVRHRSVSHGAPHEALWSPATVTKAQKSKEELRQMILKEGKASSSHWPPGMDVSVRAAACGWRVDCLPPTASRLAFTDCCDEVARIVLRLRADFDLIN